MICDRFQGSLVGEHFLAEGGVPSGIALVFLRADLATLDNVGGTEQRTRQCVDAADMTIEQVDRLAALATDLGVEIEPTGVQAAGWQQFDERQRNVADVEIELVGVPTILVVAAIDVD